MKAADGEDAAFEERVRRSREIARRGWKLAGLLYVGPALAVPILLLLSGDFEATGAAAVTGIAFVGLPLAFAAFARRPPT